MKTGKYYEEIIYIITCPYCEVVWEEVDEPYEDTMECDVCNQEFKIEAG